MLHLAANNPDSLKTILSLLPEKDRLAAVKEKGGNGHTVLHLAANNPDSLKAILTLLPEKDRLAAVKEKGGNGRTVSLCAANNPDSLKTILSLLPEKDRLAAVKEKGGNGHAVLHLAANNPDSLKTILSLYPEEDRLAAVKEKGVDGRTVWLCAANNPDSLKAILTLLPEKDRPAAVKEKNLNGSTVLHLAANNPDSLKAILTLLPEKDRPAAVKEKNLNGSTVLHLAANNPDSLKTILSLLPEKDRLAAVKEKGGNGHAVLHLAANNPDSLKTILSLYPEEDRLAAVKEKAVDGRTVWLCAANNPDSLKAILTLLPEKDRLAAVKEKSGNGCTVLHLAANNPDSLKTILSLYPEKDRLAAVKEKNLNGSTVLHLAAKNPDSLKTILTLLPEKDRLAAVKEKNLNGSTVLHLADKNPDSLKTILSLYPEEDRLAAVKEKAVDGRTVWLCAANSPDSLKAILTLLPEKDRLAAVKEKNLNGSTVLHLAANNPDSLKTILTLLPEKDRLAAVKEKSGNGCTVLHLAANNPDSLKTILTLLPEKDRLAAVKEKNLNGSTVLHLAAKNPDSLKTILSLYPEEDRLAAVKEKDTRWRNTVWHLAAPASQRVLLELVYKDILKEMTDEAIQCAIGLINTITNYNESFLTQANLVRIIGLGLKSRRISVELTEIRKISPSLVNQENLEILFKIDQSCHLTKLLSGKIKNDDELVSIIQQFYECRLIGYNVGHFNQRSQNDKTLLLQVINHLALKNQLNVATFNRLLSLPFEQLTLLKDSFSDTANLVVFSDRADAWPQTQAIAMKIHLSAKYSALPRQARDEVITTMADDDGNVQAAQKRLDGLKDMYKHHLGSDDDLSSVERNIRAKLLDDINTELENEGKDTFKDVIAFINEHRDTLATRQDNDLNQKAAGYFNSNTSHAQIAWRAYEPLAPSAGYYANLFTAPGSGHADKQLFTTRVSTAGISGDINSQSVSKHVRTYAALSFLASQDETINPEIKKDIWQDFKIYISDVRRTHNQSDTGIDAPSCFPGTMSRLSLITNKHPIFGGGTTAENAQKHVEIEVKTAVDGLFRKWFDKPELTDDQKINLHDGLMALGMANADEVIKNPAKLEIILSQIELQGQSESESDYLERTQKKIGEIFALRANFIKALLGDEGKLLERIGAKLQGKGIHHDLLLYYITFALYHLPTLKISLTSEQMALMNPLGPSQSASADDAEHAHPFPWPGEEIKDKNLRNYYIPKTKRRVFDKLKSLNGAYTDDVTKNVIDVIFSGLSALNTPDDLQEHLKGKRGEAVLSEIAELGFDAGAINAKDINQALSDYDKAIPEAPAQLPTEADNSQATALRGASRFFGNIAKAGGQPDISRQTKQLK